jgi:hypothetical protein
MMKMNVIDADGSTVVVDLPDDRASPVIMAASTRRGLEHFLAPIIPKPGEIVIVCGFKPNHKLSFARFEQVFCAVDEILIPAESAWGHGTITCEGPFAEAPKEMFERTEHNAHANGSTSFQMALGRIADPLPWLDWGSAFAQRHRLRLLVVGHPDLICPDAYRARAIKFTSDHLIRLADHRTFAYRAIKAKSTFEGGQHDGALRIAREKIRDAFFELDARTMEPWLRELPADRAAETRAAMRLAWDFMHGPMGSRDDDGGVQS